MVHQFGLERKFVITACLGFTLFTGSPLYALASSLVSITSQSSFNPQTITIHTGESVKWINTSGAVHTVTDDPHLAAKGKDSTLPAGAKSFNSGFLKSGDNYIHVFNVPGIYHYFCLLHEEMGMVGTVVVNP